MKTYEYFAKFSSETLLHVAGIVDTASNIADRLSKMNGQEDLAGKWLDLVEYFTNLLHEEARLREFDKDLIERSTGVLSYLSHTPTTIREIIRKSEGKFDKAQLRKDLLRLIKKGEVTKPSAKTYVLTDKNTEEPTKIN